MYKKTYVVFMYVFFILSIFEFYFMNPLVNVNTDQVIRKKKLKNARNEKWKKLHLFSYT